MTLSKSIFGAIVLAIIAALVAFNMVKDINKSYVLKINSRAYSSDRFSGELVIKYKEKLKEDLIITNMLNMEAIKNNVDVTDKEVNIRIKYLIEQDLIDPINSNIEERFVHNKVREDMLIERLLEVDNPTPDEGYRSYYTSNIALYLKINYRLIRFSSSDEKRVDKVREAWTKKDFNTAQFESYKNEFEEANVKESDLTHEERFLLRRIKENYFIQYHSQDKEILVLIKERKEREISYEQIKSRVMIDYGIERARLMKMSYIDQLKSRYNIVINAKYFN